MIRISSQTTFFIKKIIPLLFGIVVGGGISFPILQDIGGIPHFLPTVGSFIIGFLASRLGISMHAIYADEVLDDGEQILIRDNGREEFVKLTDIERVSYTWLQPAGVHLYLSRNSIFGRTIKFLPSLNYPGYSSLAKSLNARIKKAKEDDSPTESNS